MIKKNKNNEAFLEIKRVTKWSIQAFGDSNQEKTYKAYSVILIIQRGLGVQLLILRINCCLFTFGSLGERKWHHEVTREKNISARSRPQSYLALLTNEAWA